MNILNPAHISPESATVGGWVEDRPDATLPRNRTSPVYRVALALVAFTMVLLPVIYTALTALAGLPRARLRDDAVVVLEHAHRSPPPERAGFLIRTSLRRYGDTALSLYRIEVTP